MKKILAVTGVVIVILLAALFVIMMPAIKAMSKAGIVDFDGGLKIFTGGGGNSTVYASPDRRSIIIIDTKMGGASKKLKAYTDSVNPDAKVTVIITHEHPDHIGGNELYPKAEFIAGGHEEGEMVLLTGIKVKSGESYSIKVPDDEIEIRNMGEAHSFTDTVVYFKKRKLLITGDLVFNGWNPVLIKKGGADTDKWVQVLEYMEKKYDAKTVVPGHGAVSDGKILAQQKAYFVEIKKAINDQAQLNILKDKYKGYYHIPGFSGFDKTVEFMK